MYIEKDQKHNMGIEWNGHQFNFIKIFPINQLGNSFICKMDAPIFSNYLPSSSSYRHLSKTHLESTNLPPTRQLYFPNLAGASPKGDINCGRQEPLKLLNEFTTTLRRTLVITEFIGTLYLFPCDDSIW